MNTSLAGRWRVALRYGAREAWRNKARTALVATMILLPITVATFAHLALGAPTNRALVQMSLGPQVQARVRWDAPGAILQDYRGDSVERVIPDDDAHDSSDDGGQAATVAAPTDQPTTASFAQVDAKLHGELPTGVAATVALERFVQVEHAGRSRPDNLLQLDLHDPAIQAMLPLRAGVLPGPGEIALSPWAADGLGATIGDAVTVRIDTDAGRPVDRELTVSGIRSNRVIAMQMSVVGPDGPLVTPDVLGAEPEGTSVSWLLTGDEPVTWDTVRSVNAFGLRMISRYVLLNPPPTSEIPPMQFAPRESPISQTTLIVVAAIALEVVLLIGPSFAVSARRSAHTLALMRASGADQKAIRAVVIAQGLVTGLVATGAGLVLGTLGALIYARSPYGLGTVRGSFLLLIPIALLGVLGTTVAAWLPARGAAKVDVVAGLAGRAERATDAQPREPRFSWQQALPQGVSAVLGVLGLVLAVVGARLGQVLLLGLGTLIGVLGIVAACGPIATALGATAHRLPLTWRFALRDAGRHRARTAPAVAAVLVATAGATAALVFTASQASYRANTDTIWAQSGLLSVARIQSIDGLNRALSTPQLDRLQHVVQTELPDVGPLIEVPVIRSTPTDPDGEPAEEAVEVWVTTVRGVERATMQVNGVFAGPVVDDGTLLDLLAIPNAEAARAALASGRILVSPWQLQDDGTAQVQINRQAAGGDEWDTQFVDLPAAAVGDLAGPDYLALPVFPPAVAQQLDLPVSIGGLLATPAHPPSNTQVTELNRVLGAEFGGLGTVQGCEICARVITENAPHFSQIIVPAITTGGTALLAVAATWIAAALAATESRPDLATMSAVGAAPSTRKRLVAAQAGTIAGIGVTLGVLAGGVIGLAYVLYQRFRHGSLVNYSWIVVIPWPWILALLATIPLLALLGAWTATRKRETLTRRA